MKVQKSFQTQIPALLLNVMRLQNCGGLQGPLPHMNAFNIKVEWRMRMPATVCAAVGSDVVSLWDDGAGNPSRALTEAAFWGPLAQICNSWNVWTATCLLSALPKLSLPAEHAGKWRNSTVECKEDLFVMHTHIHTHTHTDTDTEPLQRHRGCIASSNVRSFVCGCWEATLSRVCSSTCGNTSENRRRADVHEPIEAKPLLVYVTFLFTSPCEYNTVEGSIYSSTHTLSDLL